MKNINTAEIKSLPFKLFNPGHCSTLAYCHAENRIGYFNQFSHVTVVPLLHTNKIRFIGIKDPSEIMAYKVFEDDFITLNRKGKVKTWNLLSGKFERESKLEGVEWMQQFSPHDPEYNYSYTVCTKKFGKILFKSEEAVQDFKLEDYYEPFQLKNTLEKQNTYYHNLPKSIRHWKYVEFVNSK